MAGSKRQSKARLRPKWYLFWRYRKQLRSWLWEAKVFWLFWIVIVVACVGIDWMGYFFLDWSRATKIIYAGWILEIAGVLAVATGLATKIVHYGGDGFRKRIVDWVLACPLLRKDVTIAAASASLNLGGLKVDAHLTAKVSKDRPLADRVEHLEQSLEALRKNHSELVTTTRKDFKELADKLESTADEISSEIVATKELTEKAHIGDIGLELAGLGWVVLGLTFATVPDIIQYWFGWLIDFFTWMH